MSLKVRRLGIIQHARHGYRGNGLCLGFYQVALASPLPFASVVRGNPQYISVELLIETIILEDDIQSLIPRHFIEHDR